MKLFKILFLTSFFLSGCMPRCVKYDKQGCEEASRKEYEEARIHFEQAIASDNKYWVAYSNLGGYYLVKEDYKSAIEKFVESIKIHEKNEYAYDGRATTKLAMGDTLGALNDYRMALYYLKKDKYIYTHLGTLYSSLDSCDQAVNFLELAIRNSAFDECTTKSQLEYLLNKCKTKIEKH
jgi:tetratricopeptide (TPR) repeat protein